MNPHSLYVFSKYFKTTQSILNEAEDDYVRKQNCLPSGHIHIKQNKLGSVVTKQKIKKVHLRYVMPSQTVLGAPVLLCRKLIPCRARFKVCQRKGELRIV